MIKNVEVPRNLEHFRLILLEFFALLDDLLFIIKVGSLP